MELVKPFLLQDGQCAYNITLRRVHATIAAAEQQYVLHIMGVCLALDFQHTMRMRHNVICGLSGCTILFTLSYKRQDFRKEKLLNIKCVLIFSKTFV